MRKFNYTILVLVVMLLAALWWRWWFGGIQYTSIEGMRMSNARTDMSIIHVINNRTGGRWRRKFPDNELISFADLSKEYPDLATSFVCVDSRGNLFYVKIIEDVAYIYVGNPPVFLYKERI